MPESWTPTDAIIVYAACGTITLVLGFVATVLIQVAFLTQEMIGNRTEDWWRKVTNKPPAQTPTETKDDR